MKSYKLGDLKFLIIDPNKHGRHLMRSILLEFGGAEIAMAEDGESGLEALSTFKPDVVFVEWRMASMDGLEFTRKLRSADWVPNPFVAVIMTTAHSELHHVLRARDAGVTEFLAKPLTVRSVYSRLCAIIERPRDFVRSEPFKGPDRRRQNAPVRVDANRREGDAGKEAKAETKNATAAGAEASNQTHHAASGEAG